MDECAPANGTGPAPLDQALKVGSGMDGKEGSLCAVKPAEGASGQQARALAARPRRARTGGRASTARWLRAGVWGRPERASGGAAMPWPWPGGHHATVALVASPARSKSIQQGLRSPAPQRGAQTCGAPLVCVPLTGPMEGSGYGHCTAPAAPANGTAAAAAAPRQYLVRNRATIDGRQCRLPLVYKCAAARPSCEPVAALAPQRAEHLPCGRHALWTPGRLPVQCSMRSIPMVALSPASPLRHQDKRSISQGGCRCLPCQFSAGCPAGAPVRRARRAAAERRGESRRRRPRLVVRALTLPWAAQRQPAPGLHGQGRGRRGALLPARRRAAEHALRARAQAAGRAALHAHAGRRGARGAPPALRPLPASLSDW